MKIRGVLLVLAAALSCVLATGRAHAQMIVLEIAGVQGEVTTPAAFANQILITSLQLGASKPCGNAMSVSELVVTKQMDRASVDLVAAMRDHTVYPTATFRFVRTDGQVSQSYQLTNAVVTAVSQSSGGDRASESYSFTFSQVLITYTFIDGSGKAGGTESTTLVLGSCPGV